MLKERSYEPAIYRYKLAYLAEVSGYDKSYIARILRKEVPLTDRFRKVLALAMDMTEDELFGGME